MHGNVWEWCRDWFGGYDAGVRVGDDYRLVVSTSDNRVSRGGSYSNPPGVVRSANRNSYVPSFRNHSLGLRPARTMRLRD